jgi:hypothetical protein
MMPVELSTRPEHAFFHQHPLNPSVRRIGCMSLKWEDVRLGHPSLSLRLGIPQVETTQTMALKLKMVVKRLRRDHEPIFLIPATILKPITYSIILPSTVVINHTENNTKSIRY